MNAFAGNNMELDIGWNPFPDETVAGNDTSLNDNYPLVDDTCPSTDNNYPLVDDSSPSVDNGFLSVEDTYYE